MAAYQAMPTEITAAPLRTVRPLMLRGRYANPEKELIRMLRAGRIVRIAPGTYTAKPDTVAPQTPWLPEFEDAAMAYATAQYGNRVPVLYGIGAARFHHAIPRAIAVTVIAVPEQHRPITLAGGGKIVFTTTDVTRLEARYEQAPLGGYPVTTPEQTLIDLLQRPNLGAMPAQARDAIAALVTQVDPNRVRALARFRPKTVQRNVADLLGRSAATALDSTRGLAGSA